MIKRKNNPKVVIQSIIALVCIVLTFLISKWFILPAIILLWLNHQELFGKK